jgi:LruC domain-containing protein
MKTCLIACLFLSLLSAPFTRGFALESVRLSDVIKSNGSGDIDPLKDTTATNLEQLRLDNGGELVFAVDVNEAAAGSEKASCQGITVASATLQLTIDGVEYQFSDFSTRTRTLAAIQGSSNRLPYYTLIGDAGSNRISTDTTSDLVTVFDATLRFPVDRDLSGTTRARLVVGLLDTHVALGDPEAFYDYSNGFEDVALLTAADAAYLDNLAAGRAGAPLVLPTDTYFTEGGSGRAYYPSLAGHYLAAYEDLFPQLGDYDFNDLVVAYRVYTDLDQGGSITAIGAEGYLVARGSSYSHDWHLRIGLPAAVTGSGSYSVFEPDSNSPLPGYPRALNLLGDIDIVPFEDTRSLWSDIDPDTGIEHFVNTDWRRPLLKGHRFTLHVELDNPLAQSALESPPFDPYLYVRNTGYEIHSPDKAPVLAGSRNLQDGLSGFSDANGYPFAQVFPEDWLLPSEYNDLGKAYPEYLDFVFSGRNTHTDWHKRPADNWTRPVHPGRWKW